MAGFVECYFERFFKEEFFLLNCKEMTDIYYITVRQIVIFQGALAACAIGYDVCVITF